MMPDREKVIKGLEFTKAMITFNPSTGEDIEPGNLNEANKTSYDACVGAIALLKEQEAVVLCRDCKNKECEGHGGNIVCDITGFSHPPEWFCADGEKRTD